MLTYRDKLASLDLGGPGSGDVEGHPFRGNQWSGGGASGRAESIPAGKQGECFRNAASWVRDHDSHTLVHGKVTNGHGRRLDHAWAETSTTVADPTTGVQMPKDDWYDLVKAEPEARYSPTQAMVNMVRTGNLGPWTAEEVGTRHLDLGGAGSGNFGHAGRPGEVGGSAGEGIATTVHAPGKSVQLPGRYDKTKVPKGALVVTSPHGYLTATKSSSDPDYFWVNHIRVADAAQGKGEGTALYKAALKAAQAHGSKGILKGDIPGRDVSTDAKRMWDRFDREGLTESVTTTVGGQSHTTRVLVRATAAKHLGGAGSGDVEGHPFRGNQWSEGADGGKAAERAAHEAEYKKLVGNRTRAAELAPGGRFATVEQRMAVKLDTEQRLASFATGTGPEGWSPATILGTEPNLIRAGEELATTLEEMQAQGLEMPHSILVRNTDQTVRASIRGTRIQEGSEVTTQKSLVIEIPKTLPQDASLDAAVDAVFNEPSRVIPLHAYHDTEYKTYDRYTARTMKDLIVHEMGHVQAGHRGSLPFADLLQRGTFGSTDQIRRAAMRVSEYALTNQDEFIAEAFTRLYRGETLAVDSGKLYHALQGPAVPAS